MSGELRQPVVFISAVTSELGKCRDALIRIVEDHGGAKPDGQRDFPSSLSDGLAIQHAIDQADVVVCLVGHCYGAELAKGNRPPEAEPGCSWTQWEYLYARKHAKELRLFMFDGPKAGSEPKKLSDRQAKFRKKIEKDATSTFGERFFAASIRSTSSSRTSPNMSTTSTASWRSSRRVPGRRSGPNIGVAPSTRGSGTFKTSTGERKKHRPKRKSG